MARKNENQYRLLYEQYLSSGNKSRRTFCMRNNIPYSTFNTWVNRFLPKSASSSSLLSFDVIADAEPALSNSPDIEFACQATFVLELRLTTPSGVFLDIPKITISSLSSLVKSLIS